MKITKHGVKFILKRQKFIFYMDHSYLRLVFKKRKLMLIFENSEELAKFLQHSINLHKKVL